uniref:Leucine-rich repeat-containing N-terminal plant-type domain-containing protein n=1 Tax=Nelumbo nucifera TaxID=4432 RepID=A0A822Z3I1_NELNU|nr:TPA_asm: hypothetical protein HUJ06_008676 [Nelumbo nucifera]
MKLFLLFLFMLLQNPNFAFSLSPDGLSLLALKSAVDQTSDISAFTNWNKNNTDPCHWSGISYMNVAGYSDPCIVAIAISRQNLRGYIPSKLGALIFLGGLHLYSNCFYGSIPL